MVGYRVKFLRFTFPSYIGGSLYCFKLFLIRNSDFFHRVCVHVFVLFLLLFLPVIAFYLIRIHFPFLRCLHCFRLPAAVEKNLTIGCMFAFFHSMRPLLFSILFIYSQYLLILARDFTSVACKWLCALGPMPRFP